MPTHTPGFPDLLFADSLRLRRWEATLMAHLNGAGYPELHPSLVMRDPTEPGSVRFFEGEQLVALRWDFTEALARTLVRRFQAPPPRLSYAGPVFRRPTQAWEATERREVGCERIQTEAEDRGAADQELAGLLMAVPALLGLAGCLLHLGDTALLRRPLAAEALAPGLGADIARALERRAPHRIAELLQGHPARARLLNHAEALLAGPGGPESLAALALSPYAGLLATEIHQLAARHRQLAASLPPGLSLRLDFSDLRGLDFYTGPTLRLWAPGAQRELAAGGRYDELYPKLGKPWAAAGFCVRLSTLLELGDRPERLQ